ncbi:MAG TPA: hypothetical protein VEO54_07705 [Thermoanaerobaculia bacterium]|nr:hypothetical protein [Thermoanaerobaculia bacterium]
MRREERPPTDPVNSAHDRRCQAGDGASCYSSRFTARRETTPRRSSGSRKSAGPTPPFPVGRQIAGAVAGQTSARDAHSVGGEGAALLRNQEVLRMRLQVRYGITLPPVGD